MRYFRDETEDAYENVIAVGETEDGELMTGYHGHHVEGLVATFCMDNSGVSWSAIHPAYLGRAGRGESPRESLAPL